MSYLLIGIKFLLLNSDLSSEVILILLPNIRRLFYIINLLNNYLLVKYLHNLLFLNLRKSNKDLRSLISSSFNPIILLL